MSTLKAVASLRFGRTGRASPQNRKAPKGALQATGPVELLRSWGLHPFGINPLLNIRPNHLERESY